MLVVSFLDRFFVSSGCALILPSHISIDKVRDKKESIGTTGRGIGPAYEDKIARRAVRFGDIGNEEILRDKSYTLVSYHNRYFRDLYNEKTHDVEDTIEHILSLKIFMINTHLILKVFYMIGSRQINHFCLKVLKALF